MSAEAATFVELLRKGLELYLRLGNRDGYRDRKSIVKLVTHHYRHSLEFKFSPREPGEVMVFRVPVSDIRVIVSVNSVNLDQDPWAASTDRPVPLIQLARHSTRPLSMVFPCDSARNRFAKFFTDWLRDIGISHQVYDWL